MKLLIKMFKFKLIINLVIYSKNKNKKTLAKQ